MGGLGFRTRNSPSQKTSLRWGDCCPLVPRHPITGSKTTTTTTTADTPFILLRTGRKFRNMRPLFNWGCPPLLRDCTPRDLQRFEFFILKWYSLTDQWPFPTFEICPKNFFEKVNGYSEANIFSFFAILSMYLSAWLRDYTENPFVFLITWIVLQSSKSL